MGPGASSAHRLEDVQDEPVLPDIETVPEEQERLAFEMFE